MSLANNLNYMSLTEEQKQKIEEEEYRKSIQDKLSQPTQQINVSNPRTGKNKMIIGAVIMFIGIMIMSVAAGNCSTSSAPSVFGVLFLMAGLGFIIVGKFQNWYHWR